jgi:Fasciclin domain
MATRVLTSLLFDERLNTNHCYGFQVVNGTFYSTQLGGSQLNILGQNLKFNGNTVTLQGGNSAKIVQSDILVENGVLHTIDTVLLMSGAVKRVIEGTWITAAVAAVLCGSMMAV